MSEAFASRPAQASDAALLVRLYDDSFRADFLRYGFCPGYGRSEADMLRSLAAYPKRILLWDDDPVGVLSAREDADGTVTLGCLCVVPAYQRRGVGSAALRLLEALHPNFRCIRLVTPADKAENLAFYRKNGYAVRGEQMDGPCGSRCSRSGGTKQNNAKAE